MKKAVLFGAGTTGLAMYSALKNEYDIIYAVDNDAEKHGKELAPGVLIHNKAELGKRGFDVVIISSYAGSEEIANQLVDEFGVPEEKIINHYVEPTIRAKRTFLESFSQIVYAKGIQGDVCEAGVYRGGFAKEINRCFPDRKLYLFDTYEGHDQRDVEVERQRGFSEVAAGSLSMTSEEIVMAKMPFPKQCIIKKGYFPDTFDLRDNKFCFVNIDFDLYMPIKAALELFYPRLSQGGIVLIHDYMWSCNTQVSNTDICKSVNYSYLGISPSGVSSGAFIAVDEFVQKNHLGIIPIGDGVSVAIVKN